MAQTFEDAFMDIQTGIVSLALEVLETTGQQADMLFVYVSVEAQATAANFFVQQGKKIRSASEVGCTEYYMSQFYRLTNEDITGLRKLCQARNRPCPTEIRMFYNTQTQGFNVQYQYDPVCVNETSFEVFRKWMKEEQKKLGSGGFFGFLKNKR